MFYRVTATLASRSPYSQSFYFSSTRTPKQKADDFDEAHWREHAHVIKSGPKAGHVYIPSQQLKNSLVDAATFLRMRIAGKGQSTYAKHFKAGVLVEQDVVLPVKLADVEMEAVHCAADGRPGSGTKVLRRFPLIPQWRGEVKYLIADDTINENTFYTHLTTAGTLIGIGRWRPINNGKYGKYAVESFKFEEVKVPV